jgi:hypothetical protein
MLVWAGFNTQHDFNRWLNGDLYLFFERHLYAAADYLIANTDEATPIYFAPFAPTHPVLRFHNARLAPRPIGSFDATQCWILSPQEALYYSLTMFDTTFPQRLAQFADIEPVLVTERDAIYRVVPHADIFTSSKAIRFEGGIVAWLLTPLPETMQRGETLDIMVELMLEQPQPDDLTLFVHLYGDPTPYEGGVLWGQTDQPLCEGSPARFWRVSDALVQPTYLSIPATTPPGDYEIAFGLYRTQSLQRLSSGDLNYVIVQSVTISD